MRCCVRNCSNTAKKKRSENLKISFHLFPKDPKLRNAWLKALSMNDWELNERTVVCSDHFKDGDLFVINAKTGSRRINNDAVPHIIDIDPEAPAVMRICKICLTLDAKLYHIRKLQLDEMYEEIIGVSVIGDELFGYLPTHLCWECAARLKSAASLKTKALFADMQMRELLKTTPCVKVQDILSIHKKHNNLKSSLIAQHIFNSKYFEDSSEETDLPENVHVKTDFDDTQSTEDIVKDEENEDEENEDVERYKIIIDKTEHIPNEDGNDDSFGDYSQLDDDYGDDGVTLKEEVVNAGDIKASDYDDEDYETEWIELSTFYSDDTDGGQISEEDYDVSFSDMTLVRTEGDETENFSSDTEMAEIKNEEVVTSESLKNAESRIKRKRDTSKPHNRLLPLDEDIIKVTKLTDAQMKKEVSDRKKSDRYKNAKFKCDVCYRSFPTNAKNTRHAVRHSEISGAYECSICKTRFKHATALLHHMHKLHTAEYSCNLCPYITRYRANALAHVKFHGGNMHKCPMCDTEFAKRSTLLTHLRWKHVLDTVCELCGQTFVSQHGVQVHRRLKHPLVKKDITLDGPYCKKCDITFLSQEAYDTHLRVSAKHLKKEEYPPRMSNNRVAKSKRGGVAATPRAIQRQESEAEDTEKKLKGNEPVDCERCGVTLPNPRSYVYHFKTIHPGVNRTKFSYMRRPHMCEQCGKMFFTAFMLKTHQWVHTGVKCFQCDHCQHSFTQKENLVKHLRTVHETKAARLFHECPECGKLFSSEANKKRHMFLHTGQKPFICDTCGKRFTTLGESRLHVDHVHLKKPRPKRVRIRRRIKKYDDPDIED